MQQVNQSLLGIIDFIEVNGFWVEDGTGGAKACLNR